MGAIRLSNDLDGLRRYVGLFQCAPNQVGESIVRALRFLTAPQDAGVSAFQGQRCDVNGHVWPRLINASDKPKRHASPADQQSVWECPASRRPRQLDRAARRPCGSPPRLPCRRSSLSVSRSMKYASMPAASAAADVRGVSFQNRPGVLLNEISQLQQSIVTGRCGEAGEMAGRGFRRLGLFSHG